jgi:hypothetical protein
MQPLSSPLARILAVVLAAPITTATGEKSMFTIYKTLRITVTSDPKQTHENDHAITRLSLGGWTLHGVFPLDEHSIFFLWKKEFDTEGEAVKQHTADQRESAM